MAQNGKKTMASVGFRALSRCQIDGLLRAVYLDEQWLWQFDGEKATVNTYQRPTKPFVVLGKHSISIRPRLIKHHSGEKRANMISYARNSVRVSRFSTRSFTGSAFCIAFL